MGRLAAVWCAERARSGGWVVAPRASPETQAFSLASRHYQSRRCRGPRTTAAAAQPCAEAGPAQLGAARATRCCDAATTGCLLGPGDLMIVVFCHLPVQLNGNSAGGCCIWCRWLCQRACCRDKLAAAVATVLRWSGSLGLAQNTNFCHVVKGRLLMQAQFCITLASFVYSRSAPDS